MTSSFTMDTPIGKIDVTEEDGALVSILLFSSRPATRPETYGGREIERELTEYFEKRRSFFSIPLAPKGTIFQKRVWEETEKIPYGSVMSYGELGERIGSRAYRAIGQALGKNPIPIVIPCHRVVGKQGPGGYTGGLGTKERLLAIEGVRL